MLPRHQWFREGKSTLLFTTVDSTGKPLYGLFQEEEDLEGSFQVSKKVFTRFVCPSVFSPVRASLIVTTRHKLGYVAEHTQFQRSMSEYGIQLVFPCSPQTQGRGERINSMFRDRLVAE
jgi:hypothetical protein